MSRILVAGATGFLGSEICRQLRTARWSVRGLVRETSRPDKVSRLHFLGVETVEGDVRDRTSLDRACEGVTHVITTVSAMPFSYVAGVNDIQTVDLEGVTNLIEAAKTSQISHFVYISAGENGLRLQCPLSDAKNEIERKLKDSGLTYTILRPGPFMDVWLSPAVGFDAANGKVVIYGTGKNPISWIAVRDIAKFAILSLEHPAAKNTVIELGGPQAISPLDIVRYFEEAQGRSFEMQFVPVEALQAQEAAAIDPMQKSFNVMMQFMDQENRIEMSETITRFAIRLTPLQEYIKHIANSV